MYRWAQKAFQTLSKTERQALQRTKKQQCSVYGEVVQGRRKQPLLELLPASLDAKEEHWLEEWKKEAGAIFRSRDDKAIHAYACQKRLYALETPTHYGGAQMSTYLHSRLLTLLASLDRSGRWVHQIMVPNSLGPNQLLLEYGTQEQRERFLPQLSSGEKLASFGLTGPWNGSDAADMPITGRLEKREGVEGLVFSCEKRWITLSPIADLWGLAIRVEGQGITLLLLDRSCLSKEDQQKITVRWHRPLGSNFANGHILIRDLWVPLETSVLGGKEQVGKGWSMLMECLAHGRGVSLPSVGLGSMTSVVWLSTFYSLTRRQFQKPLLAIYGVQSIVAENMILLVLSLALQKYYHACRQHGETSSSFSALMKWTITEYQRKVVQNGMDVFAGKGLTLGDKNPIVHHYLQSPLAITVEGSNTLTSHLIVPVQSIFEHHPFFPRLLRSLDEQSPRDFYRAVGDWSANLAGHAVPALLGDAKSKMVWMQWMLLCQGKKLRDRQDLTRKFAVLLQSVVLEEAVQWFYTHHGARLQLPDRHTVLRFLRNPSRDSLSTQEIDTWALLLLRNSAFREFVEQDLLLNKHETAASSFDDDWKYWRIRERWSQRDLKFHHHVTVKELIQFNKDLPEDWIRDIIEVDSYAKNEPS